MSSSSSSSSSSSLWCLLCDPVKLERDKGLQRLQQCLQTTDANVEELDALQTDMRRWIESSSSSTSTSPWEQRLGFLLAANALAEAVKEDEGSSSSSSSSLLTLTQPFALTCLKDDESRVREAAGSLLGSLCAARGPSVYEACHAGVLGLIRESLEREASPSVAASSPSVARPASPSKEALFHDTAGWRHLETSMKCLREMVEGCGRRRNNRKSPDVDMEEPEEGGPEPEVGDAGGFRPYLTADLVALIGTALEHENRFVRETGYYTLSALIQAAPGHEVLGSGFSSLVARGLADNWSQVRLAAAVACRRLLLSERKEDYFPEILPRLCLNRYYLAEGVRLYCQETWRLAMGERGKEYVERHLEQVATYYVACTRAENHAVREAACQCIAELAVKLQADVVRPKASQLLDVLVECFDDDSWPVRDAAGLAAGRFVRAFPEECRPKLDVVFPLLLANLKDPIASVRQGGAASLSNILRAYEQDDGVFARIVDVIREGLDGVKEQPSESERYGDLSKGPASFGVAKSLRDNDPAKHENQVMYSCGSLAPKMGRGGGGGCTSATFRRPSEPWEFCDGAVLLYAEVLALRNSQFNAKLHSILAKIARACHVRHYAMHLTFIETVLKLLPSMADNLGKRMFKPYLEEFMDSLFYACDGCGAEGSALARHAAERCVVFLDGYLGPNIWRGRVEGFNPRYLDVLERVMAAGGPGEEEAMDVSAASAPVAIQGGYGQQQPAMPHLGGTPT